MRFADRDDAGRQLAELVRTCGVQADALVLGLPRGGVVPAARVARGLGAELGVVVARKVRVPGHAELAMGAVAVWAGRDAVVRNDRVLTVTGVPPEAFAASRAAEIAAAHATAADLAPYDVDCSNRTVVVVDDGLATGATMRAALAVLRGAGAGRLIAAVPVGAAAELSALAASADEVVCAFAPRRFGSVGAHYADFRQVPEATVRELLARSRGA